MNTIFSLASLPVLPFWLLMIFAPNLPFTRRMLSSPWIAALPSVLYAALVLPRLGDILPAVASPSLAVIQTLLGTPSGATIAWVHFLAFDLLAGRWIYLDAQERRLSPLLTAPVLFFTLMIGPVGFLAYLLLRLTGRPGSTAKEPGVE